MAATEPLYRAIKYANLDANRFSGELSAVSNAIWSEWQLVCSVLPLLDLVSKRRLSIPSAKQSLCAIMQQCSSSQCGPLMYYNVFTR